MNFTAVCCQAAYSVVSMVKMLPRSAHGSSVPPNKHDQRDNPVPLNLPLPSISDIAQLGSSSDSMSNRLDRLYEEVREVYLNYPYPWVIGYSGGKDSTATLQVVWTAIEQLPPEQRTKKVFVISTNTLVETPMIVDHTGQTIDLLNVAAVQKNMPFAAHKLSPVLDDTFWVNLIGRGYPAPTSIFRWCTERLKINPSNHFILTKVAEYGEVVLVLGSRRGESITRDQVIKDKGLAWHKLSRHGQLPGAWVYMPIEHFTTDDVWTYLFQVKSPWGGDNRQLSALYRSAQDGECPLVVDTTTPSCGNSRFGCWVCTVVTRDKSMEAMIDSGEDWMIPLLDFRDWLASTQDPAVKSDQREYKGRDGTIKITDDGRLRYRTYTIEFSRKMLRRLLEAQSQIQVEYKRDFSLIGEDELREIRRLWLTERQDWEDSLPTIYQETTGHKLNWERDDLYVPGQLESELLRNLCTEHGVPLQLVQKLFDAEWQHYGMRRRVRIHKAIEKAFREDWRSIDEVRTEMKRRQEIISLGKPS